MKRDTFERDQRLLWARFEALLESVGQGLRELLDFSLKISSDQDFLDKVVHNLDGVYRNDAVRRNVSSLDDLDLRSVISVFLKNFREVSKKFQMDSEILTMLREISYLKSNYFAHPSKKTRNNVLSLYGLLSVVERTIDGFVACDLSDVGGWKVIASHIEELKAGLDRYQVGGGPTAERSGISRLNLDSYVLSCAKNPNPIRNFCGREDHLDKLLEWATDNRHNNFSLFGPPGSGKTSLAVEFVRQLADVTDQTIRVGTHFIGRPDPESHDLNSMALSLGAQVGIQEEWSNYDENLSSGDLHRRLMNDICELVKGEPGRIIFVIDGLDELPTIEQTSLVRQVKAWQSKGIRCCVFSRKVDYLEGITPQINLSCDDEDNLEDIRKSTVGAIKRLKYDPSEVDRVAQSILNKVQGQWAYQTILLEKLRVGRIGTDEIDSCSNELEGYYAATIQIQKEGVGDTRVYLDSIVPCLALFAITTRPLTYLELAQVTGVDAKYTRNAIKAIRELLTVCDTEDSNVEKQSDITSSKFQLFHLTIREFLLDDEDVRVETPKQASNLLKAHINDPLEFELSRLQIKDKLCLSKSATTYLDVYSKTNHLAFYLGRGGVSRLQKDLFQELSSLPRSVIRSKPGRGLLTRTAILLAEISKLTGVPQTNLRSIKLAINKPELTKALFDTVIQSRLGYAELIAGNTLKESAKAFHLYGNNSVFGSWVTVILETGCVNKYMQSATLASRLAVLGGADLLWSETDSEFDERLHKTMFINFRGWSSYDDIVQQFDLWDYDLDSEPTLHEDHNVQLKRSIYLVSLRQQVRQDTSCLGKRLHYIIRVMSKMSWTNIISDDPIGLLCELVRHANQYDSLTNQCDKNTWNALNDLAKDYVGQNDFVSFIIVIRLLNEFGDNQDGGLIVDNAEWIQANLEKTLRLFCSKCGTHLYAFHPGRNPEEVDFERYILEDCEDVTKERIDQYLGWIVVTPFSVNVTEYIHILESFSQGCSDIKVAGVLQDIRVNMAKPDLYDTLRDLDTKVFGKPLVGSKRWLPNRKRLRIDPVAGRLLSDHIKEMLSGGKVFELGHQMATFCEIEFPLEICQQLTESIVDVALVGNCKDPFAMLGTKTCAHYFDALGKGRLEFTNMMPEDYGAPDLLLLVIGKRDPKFICSLIDKIEYSLESATDGSIKWMDFVSNFQVTLYRTVLCLPKTELEYCLKRLMPSALKVDGDVSIFEDDERYLERFFSMSKQKLETKLSEANNGECSAWQAAVVNAEPVFQELLQEIDYQGHETNISDFLGGQD